MRVILSRKGFDSASGGLPSPITPEWRARSLPIPHRDATRYCDIGGDIPMWIEALAGSRGIEVQTRCHLDPDLDPANLPRLPGWRPCFGQASAAAKHLHDQGVGLGDLFLFFGWFRHVECTSYGGYRYAGPHSHVLFGWLQIGEIVEVGDRTAETHPWLADHPHVASRNWEGCNTVYVAAEQLVLPSGPTGLPGGGTFEDVLASHVLTKPGANRTTWLLPSFMAEDGVRLSYHENRSLWRPEEKECELQSMSRGQEFVLHTPDRLRSSLSAWLDEVFDQQK